MNYIIYYYILLSNILDKINIKKKKKIYKIINKQKKILKY